MPLGVHLSREVSPFLVDDVAVLAEKSHRLDGEGEHRLGSFLIEPLHEALLEPAQRFPLGLASVGEDELSEEALEVGTVVVGDVPEHRLVVARAGRLVDGVDNLLEAVADNLVDGALLCRDVNLTVGVQIVVVTVLTADEVVEVHEKLGCGARTAQHARHHEYHVDEPSAEGLQVRRSRRVSTDGTEPFEEPGVHCDGGAVVCEARLVVLVDEVLVKQAQVLVGQLLAVHFLQPLGEHSAVEADEALLGQLADERGDVLLLHVGVGVELAACGCVGRVAIINKEGKFVEHLAVFGVLLAVEHERLGYGKVLLSHQGYFYLILNLFHAHAVGYVDAAKDVGQLLLGGEGADGEECFTNGIFDFLDGERLAGAVSFNNLNFRTAHICLLIKRLPSLPCSLGKGYRDKVESSFGGAKSRLS